MQILTAVCVFSLWLTSGTSPQEPAFEQGPNTWVKRTPLVDGPPSPRLGYEGDCVWLPKQRLFLRYGGHNQGGGGEQGSEIWLCDPFTGKWTLREPNTSPPGVCCAQQNVYDPAGERYLRFPAFSASHGWQWRREVYLNGSAVWAYDVEANRWRNRAPLPAPSLRALRCASWDEEHQVVVLFGGEGSREGTLIYDPYTNVWTKMDPPAQPEFRSAGNMAYDSARKVHILFGAQFSDDPHTWSYDLRKNRWTDLKPEGMPPTNKNDAVLTYDPLNRRIIAIVKISEGEGKKQFYYLDTWTYDAGKNAWKKMKPEREPTPTGNRCRVLVFAPEFNAAILENCPGRPREQQIWTYRLAGPKRPARPRRAEQVVVRTGRSRAELTWKPIPGEVEIFRGAGATPWKVEVERLAIVEGNSYVDEGLERGTVYTYFVRSEADSLKVRTQPRPVTEITVSVRSKKEVRVSWGPRPEKDVVGYHVERAVLAVLTGDQIKILRSRTPSLEIPSVGAIRKVGPFHRLTEAPVAGTEFVDRTVDFDARQAVEGEPEYVRNFGKKSLVPEGRPYPYSVYAYRVRAVNALGVAGGPSAVTLSIPSSPQHVFSREDGTSCHLKWRANPEESVRGYRVYRMNGRWDKDRVQRLTEEPLEALDFTDPEAGKGSRRYYIVAVDGLGQEGPPSSPVWFEREWQKYYRDFIEDWHQ